MLPPCRAWNDLHRRSAGAEDFAAMAKRSDEDLFQILIGQIRQDREIYIIISKALGILGHAELFEPAPSPASSAAPLPTDRQPSEPRAYQ
jgi:hypothetical protein